MDVGVAEDHRVFLVQQMRRPERAGVRWVRR